MSSSMHDSIALRTSPRGDPDAHSSDTGTSAAQVLSHLAAIVHQQRVCWEVWPEWVIVDSHRRQAGYTLELSAPLEHGLKHTPPACPHCQWVYAALHAIAAHILPHHKQSSIYDRSACDHAIHYSPIRGGRPDVCLTIGLYQRNDLNGSVARCQERCLPVMKERLREIGARERQRTFRRGTQQ